MAHDQDALGDDTGSMLFQADRDMAQAYLPVGTDTAGPLAVHGYLVQGAFGTSANDVGGLRSTAWTYADADEAGLPYAYSLDTRVRTNLLVSAGTNHYKRVEVVRPGGNAVVFEFAWDPAAGQFAAAGTPAGWGGRDARRLYVLRDLTPQDDADLAYELRFPSGVVHVFNEPLAPGALSAVRDGSGLSRTVPLRSTLVSPAGAAFTAAYPQRYEVDLNWSGGRVSGLDYLTKNVAAGTDPEEIHTQIGYVAGDPDGVVWALAKTIEDRSIPEFSYERTDPSGILHRGVEVDREGSAAGGTVVLTVKNAPGQSNFAGQTTDQVTLNADGLVTAYTHTLDDGTGTPSATTAFTTTYEYQADNGRYAKNLAPKWGKVVKVVGPDGAWETFAYEADAGWLSEDHTPFKNGTAGGSTADEVVQTYTYTAASVGKGDAEDYTRLTERPRAVQTYAAGVRTDAVLARYDGQTVTTRHLSTHAEAGWNQPAIQTVSTLTSSGSGYDYKLATPTGNLTEHVTRLAGGITSATVRSAYFADPDAGSPPPSRSETVAKANPFGAGTYTKSTGPGLTPVEVKSDAASDTDAFGRPLHSAATGGVTGSYGGWGWSGPASSTAADGTVTSYTYTPLGQVKTATVGTLTVSYGYDAAGDVVSVTRSGTKDGQSLTTTTTSAYDARGRVARYTDELNRTTTYGYSDFNPSTGAAASATTTYTDGTTEVDAFNLDGSPVSVRGTAVTPADFDQGVDANGDTWAKSSTNDGHDWTKTTSDALGRAYKAETSTANGSVAGTTEYDGNGRPKKSTAADGTVTLYRYDPRTGTPITVLDVDRDGQFTPNVDTRTTVAYTLPTVASGEWAGTTVKIHSDAGTRTSFAGVKNGGLDTQSVADGFTATAHVDLSTSEPTITATAADGTKVRDTYAGGLLKSRERLDTVGMPVTANTFGYDGLRRLTAVADPAYGPTPTRLTLRLDGSVQQAQYPDGRSEGVTSVDPKTNIPKATTRTDGKAATQDVSGLGQVTKVDGAGTYPATLAYDPMTGAPTGLSTFRSGSPANANDPTKATTTWHYQPATGLVDAKTYNDGSVDGFHYNDRLQVDAVNRPGQTTNGFVYNTVGELDGWTTNDMAGGQLAAAVKARDDLGRVKVATETAAPGGAGTAAVTATQAVDYTAIGQLRLDKSGPSGAAVTYEYYGPTQTTEGASPGAVKAMKVVSGAAVLSETEYKYDATTRRLQTVTVKDGAGATLRTFTYAYKANTDRVETVAAAGGPTTTWGYEAQNLRLGSVGTAAGSTNVYSAALTYYDNDQRHTETGNWQAVGGAADAYQATYEYDDRDELTDVTTSGGGGPAEGHWAYDGVGNRTGTSVPAGGAAANALNQYRAAAGGGFQYDGRGNLTDDGTSTYDYDPADRLVRVTPNTVVATSRRVEFAYDPQGRRVEKRTYAPDPANAGTWVLADTRRYAFSGRAVVAEFDGANALRRAYAWGPTGLLAVTDYPAGGQPQSYTAVPDGSGNVVALVDSSGAVAATFRYDAWGTVVADGPAAGVCPVGWGGGYRDAETGLVLLDARYYSPAQGRFLTRDPAAEAGGVNLYAYCGNDPVNLADPSGLGAVPLNLPQGERPRLQVPAETPVASAVPTANLASAPTTAVDFAKAVELMRRQAMVTATPRCAVCHNSGLLTGDTKFEDLSPSEQVAIARWTGVTPGSYGRRYMEAGAAMWDLIDSSDTTHWQISDSERRFVRDPKDVVSQRTTHQQWFCGAFGGNYYIDYTYADGTTLHKIVDDFNYSAQASFMIGNPQGGVAAKLAGLTEEAGGSAFAANAVSVRRTPPGMAEGSAGAAEVFDFGTRYREPLEQAVANRMRQVGVPEELIGIRGWPGIDETAMVPGSRIGGNQNPLMFPGRQAGINVDYGVLDTAHPAMEGVPSWARARLLDRVDAAIAHEYHEVLAMPHPEAWDFHQQALILAPDTSLNISPGARQILSEYRALEGLDGVDLGR